MGHGYEAVVYDLDGTLVELDVDWTAVADDVAAALAERDVDPGDRGLWGMLELSVETGHRSAVEAAIGDHELAGAETARALSLADGLPHEVPVGVCSLNGESAVRRALTVHGLTEHVDAVVGRDTVASFKPDPDPLLAALDELGATPDEAAFVGDSRRDLTTAERADVDFHWAREWPP